MRFLTNENLKVDRNLGVLILYFGFKEILCLCDFQNTSCKSAVFGHCFSVIGSNLFMPFSAENIRCAEKMKPQNLTSSFRVICMTYRVNGLAFRVKV